MNDNRAIDALCSIAVVRQKIESLIVIYVKKTYQFTDVCKDDLMILVL